MTDQLIVDVDALRRGGINIDEVARTCHSILRELYSAVAEYAGAGGDGEIGKAMQLNYEPGRDDAMEFLDLLIRSLSQHGDRTLTVGNVFHSTNDGATTTAHGGKPH